MARPGPAPKPTETKKRAGNPGNRPLNKDEPKPEPGAPPMPPHMEFEAAETWGWLCEVLAGMGLLAKSDVAIMMAYCDAYSEYLEARKQVEDEGLTCTGEKGGQYMNPAFSAESSLRKQLVSYAAELGLTPSARSRIQVTPPAEDDEKTAAFRVVGVVG